MPWNREMPERPRINIVTPGGAKRSAQSGHQPGWARQPDRYGSAERPEGLREEIRRVAQGTASWLESGEQVLPDHLPERFRDMALAYRFHGFSVTETLSDLGDLEEALYQDSGESPSPKHWMRLRRAMRVLVEEVVRLNRTLDRRRHREQYDALEAFREILSHELGNRLGAARTAVEILSGLGPDVGEDRRVSLTELITESLDAAMATVDDVTSLMSTHAHLDHDSVELGDVVDTAARSVRPVARRGGVRIEVERPLPEALVDGSRMRLVLSNLLLNGARYADPTKEERFVRLSASVSESELEIEVRDNGVGIEESERARIFDIHQRGRSAEDLGKGSGLGLAIVREAVEQIHGTIELESEAGQGSVFRIAAPLALRRSTESENADSPPH